MTTQPAPRFEGRTVELALSAPFEGWEAVWRADFPARYLADMADADSWPALCAVLDRWLVVEHNFPDAEGNLAGSMLDVYPLEAVGAAMAAFRKATGTLPNP